MKYRTGQNQAVIVSYSRTAIGSFLGSLSKLSATKLGSEAIKGAIQKISLDVSLIDEVLMGNVLSAGIGQAPARQAALAAGIKTGTPCTTVSKVCGSGLKSVMLGAQSILCGDAEVVVAGGMESMSQSPYLLEKARDGFRMGHGKVIDSMIKDGLWDPYSDFHMGNAAEVHCKEKSISREVQDQYAKQSYERSLAAQKAGIFKAEIKAIEIKDRKGNVTVIESDEEPGRGRPDKLPKLRAAFDKEGTITAGNASSINDGAAAVVLMSEAKAKELGLKVLAKIVDFTQAAQDPIWFTTAPTKATQKLLERQDIKATEVDLYEINEAFSSVALGCINDLGLSQDRVNVYGGAVSMGHPIGASGTRILVTLLNAMEQKNQKTGIATLCIGGGEAVSMLVERG